jgi:hypothetical protein
MLYEKWAVIVSLPFLFIFLRYGATPEEKTDFRDA